MLKLYSNFNGFILQLLLSVSISYILLIDDLAMIFKLFLFLIQTLPRLLDSPSLENIHAKVISCGARHSAIIAGM